MLDKKVVVYVIADGRRDMQSLCSRRLLSGDAKMRPAYNAKAPKCPVNLSLNADLIAQARDVTHRSEVVESLLADFVSKERAQREAQAQALQDAVQTWNAFGEKHGSFADEHSTL